MLRLWCLLVLSILLASCGQTGPLYLPGHPPPGYGHQTATKKGKA